MTTVPPTIQQMLADPAFYYLRPIDECVVDPIAERMTDWFIIPFLQLSYEGMRLAKTSLTQFAIRHISEKSGQTLGSRMKQLDAAWYDPVSSETLNKVFTFIEKFTLQMGDNSPRNMSFLGYPETTLIVAYRNIFYIARDAHFLLQRPDQMRRVTRQISEIAMKDLFITKVRTKVLPKDPVDSDSKNDGNIRMFAASSTDSSLLNEPTQEEYLAEKETQKFIEKEVNSVLESIGKTEIENRQAIVATIAEKYTQLLTLNLSRTAFRSALVYLVVSHLPTGLDEENHKIFSKTIAVVGGFMWSCIPSYKQLRNRYQSTLTPVYDAALRKLNFTSSQSRLNQMIGTLKSRYFAAEESSAPAVVQTKLDHFTQNVEKLSMATTFASDIPFIEKGKKKE